MRWPVDHLGSIASRAGAYKDQAAADHPQSTDAGVFCRSLPCKRWPADRLGSFTSRAGSYKDWVATLKGLKNGSQEMSA